MCTSIFQLVDLSLTEFPSQKLDGDEIAFKKLFSPPVVAAAAATATLFYGFPRNLAIVTASSWLGLTPTSADDRFNVF